MKKTEMREETRVCRLCLEEKPTKLFEIDRRVQGGHTSRCKKCKSGLNDRARSLLSRLEYRARENGAEVDVTLNQLRALFAAFDGMCVYCSKREDETGVSHHVDHVVPVSRSGTHHISNLVLACASCNSRKNDKPFATFFIESSRENFSEENFHLMEGYLSLIAGIPIKEFREKIIQEHADYHVEKMLEDLDKRAKELKEMDKRTEELQTAELQTAQ